MYVCVFKWACEPVHVSMNVQSQARGLHRDLVNSEHFCPHKASLGLNVPVQVYADVGNHGWAPGSGAGYFLNSEDELRSKKSPLGLVALLPLPSPSALKASHSGHLPHPSQHFPLPTSPSLPPPSLSQHPLLPLHLRALPPTSSQALLLPATPLYSAGDSL